MLFKNFIKAFVVVVCLVVIFLVVVVGLSVVVVLVLVVSLSVVFLVVVVGLSVVVFLIVVVSLVAVVGLIVVLGLVAVVGLIVVLGLVVVVGLIVVLGLVVIVGLIEEGLKVVNEISFGGISVEVILSVCKEVFKSENFSVSYELENIVSCFEEEEDDSIDLKNDISPSVESNNWVLIDFKKEIKVELLHGITINPIGTSDIENNWPVSI